MKVPMFVVFDLKSKTTASQIMLAQNEAIIKRNLISYGRNMSPSIQRFPEDFAVFKLGEYDDTELTIVPVKQPEMCFSMKEVIDYARIDSES